LQVKVRDALQQHCSSWVYEKSATGTERDSMTRSWKVKLPAGLAIVILAAYVVFLEVEANQDSADRFASPAIWDAGDRALQQIRDACKNAGGEDYSQCFIDQMADVGASPEAIDFTQEYAIEHGEIAILADFHPQNAVDLGHVYFPRDNSRGLVLLNGLPEIINANDTSTISQQLGVDPRFAALRNTHPQIGVFLNGKAGVFPPMQRLAGGGQRFVIDYSLRDGCATCAQLGRAEVAFDFDPAGQFQGTRVMKVEPLSASGGER
jgi:hypothetical protein